MKKNRIKESTSSTIMNIDEFEVYLSRKQIKNINVRIDANGTIKVSAPIKCPLHIIQQLLKKKQHWIRTHQARARYSLPSTTLNSGDPHLFLGHAYSLRIHEHASQQEVKIEGEYVCCYLHTAATQEKKQALLTQWQRQQMQLLLPAIIQKWENIIGVHVKQWTIRAMKTRWGTCHTTLQRICLNLYLIQKPLICLEYVVVHELVHLLETSHNQRFYALMTQFMPQWKEYRYILAQTDMNIPLRLP